MIRRLRLKFVCINMAIVLLMLCATLGTVLWLNQRSTEQENLRRMENIVLAPHRGHTPRQSVPDGTPRPETTVLPDKALFPKDAADPNAAPFPEEPLPGTPFTGIRMPYFILWEADNGTLEAEGGALTAEGSAFSDLSGEETLKQLYTSATAENASPTGILPEHRLRYLRADTPLGLRVIFADISNELAAQRALLRTCLLIGAASAAAFLLISLLLARWAVKPVEEAWKQQRQFVSDASHELKTPLTVILTNAELLQTAPDAPSRTRFTENILIMSRQMRELLEALLELARADDGNLIKQSTQTINLSRLVANSLLPFEPLYYENGLTLTSEIEEGITIRGSEHHLKQVLNILFDNAQKYTTPSGSVTITLQKTSKRHCRLTVSNTSPPLTPTELRSIFKRFYRTDEARRRDGSYGLGLPIAEAIVTRHSGRIWAESSDNQTRFILLLRTGGAAP